MADNAGRVKIVSDGTPEGTKVLDSQGVPIGEVKSLYIRIVAGDPRVTATLELYRPELDIDAVVSSPTLGRCDTCPEDDHGFQENG